MPRVGTYWPPGVVDTARPFAVQLAAPAALMRCTKTSGASNWPLTMFRKSSHMKYVIPVPSITTSLRPGVEFARLTTETPEDPHCATPLQFSRWLRIDETPPGDSPQVATTPPVALAGQSIRPSVRVEPGTPMPPAVHCGVPAEFTY